MLKLRRLRVEKFRSLAKETELLFSDGINVLLGQNGTGKTTLLELISMVVRSDFRALAEEEFAVEYELSMREAESLIVIVRNECVSMQQTQTPVELQVRNVFRPSAEVFEGVGRRPLLRYDAELGLSVGDRPPLGPAGVLSSLDRGFLFFFLATLPGIDDDFLLDLQEVGNAYRVDESLELFKKVTSVEGPDGELIISDRDFGPGEIKNLSSGR
ncbi:MAG TPA: AAA family ATPase [Kofleriaceae bacterium]|nr:AAA family ATPase [Kofleriaceae bacterium]